MRHHELYLGDGAYVYKNDFNDVVLYTSDGINETNHVVLEPEVFGVFMKWVMGEAGLR